MLCYLKQLCWLHIYEEGPCLTPIPENLDGRLWTHNCLPDSQSDNTDLCAYKSGVTRCRGYRGSCEGVPNPTIWQTHLSSLKWDQITQRAEIRWFRRRRYKYPPGRPGSNPRGERAFKKIYIMCLMAIVPINISTQWCKLTEPGMMNIYWTKIKLWPTK